MIGSTNEYECQQAYLLFNTNMSFFQYLLTFSSVTGSDNIDKHTIAIHGLCQLLRMNDIPNNVLFISYISVHDQNVAIKKWWPLFTALLASSAFALGYIQSV